jgi:hypothetical protein
MGSYAHVRLNGDIEGDYVVLAKSARGILKIAPENHDGVPKVATLRQTTWACPTQWEGTLEDGRILYARCRRGELSVGVGEDIDSAVRNSMGDDALYFEHVADEPLSLEELRAHLYGLLEFPADLVVEGERR